jgi:hypothetical protein
MEEDVTRRQHQIIYSSNGTNSERKSKEELKRDSIVGTDVKRVDLRSRDLYESSTMHL